MASAKKEDNVEEKTPQQSVEKKLVILLYNEIIKFIISFII